MDKIRQVLCPKLYSSLVIVLIIKNNMQALTGYSEGK